MLRVRVFDGIDESSPHYGTISSRSEKMMSLRRPLSEETIQKTERLLQQGARDPIVDALFVSCALCGKRLEAPEMFFEAGNIVYVWQLGSEHYVRAHQVYPKALERLVAVMEKVKRTVPTGSGHQAAKNRNGEGK